MAAGGFSLRLADSDGSGVLRADRADEFDRDRTSLGRGICCLARLHEVNKQVFKQETLVCFSPVLFNRHEGRHKKEQCGSLASCFHCVQPAAARISARKPRRPLSRLVATIVSSSKTEPQTSPMFTVSSASSPAALATVLHSLRKVNKD